MISFKHRGNFNHIRKFMNRVQGKSYLNILDKYGMEGVNALSAATPVDSGETASSWTYMINHTPTSTSISWSNSHVNDGVCIAILLQYGHGTRTGGFVSGRDYINPAMRPIFDKIAQEAWKEVTSS
jgi:hypothetical protein